MIKLLMKEYNISHEIDTLITDINKALSSRDKSIIKSIYNVCSILTDLLPDDDVRKCIDYAIKSIRDDVEYDVVLVK